MYQNRKTNQEKYINEFKNVPKDLIGWLEDLAYENRCKIDKKEWKSKYNNYVIYDYEPFCSEGFEINITLSSTCKEYVDFVRYLYNHKLENILYLKECLKL